MDLDPGFFVRVDPLAHPGYRPENLGERMAASASGAGLAVLDLFQVMAGGGAGDLFVGGDDFHWNESGIELAAEGEFDAVLVNGVLEEALLELERLMDLA